MLISQTGVLYPERSVQLSSHVQLSVVERFKTKGCVDVRYGNISRTKTVSTEEN